MSIHPNILKLLNTEKQQTARYQPELVAEEGADGLPVLRGTEKQVKWATTIRADVLSLKWPASTHAMLRRVADSSWWIANREMVRDLKFKPPAPHQLAGNTTTADAAPVELPSSSPDASHESVEHRISDAQQWAASVSRTPKLAEAALLAVLARLYREPAMQQKLRDAAQEAMQVAVHEHERDKDAIRRILSL